MKSHKKLAYGYQNTWSSQPTPVQNYLELRKLQDLVNESQRTAAREFGNVVEKFGISEADLVRSTPLTLFFWYTYFQIAAQIPNLE